MIGNSVYELATVPSEPTVTGIPSCPSGSHQIFGGAKCLVNGVSCPSGTVLINDMMCGPEQKATTTTTPPPAAPPTNTPPVQPQPPQQLAPSQPECVPGFHWDISQRKCVAG